jgi:integrase
MKKVKFYQSVPEVEIGEFMVSLRSNVSISARALEFTILTSMRSGSVRLAEWSEIDLSKKLWIIPPEHFKTRQEFRVPLQAQAIKLLRSLPRIAGSEKIFPSASGKALSDMALSQLMRGMRERGELTVDAVPHGFRSTFRDWAAEQTNYPDEIRKAASGHAIGDAVKEAYQHSDLLEKRRQLMMAWAAFIDRPAPIGTSNLSPIRRKA